MCARRAHCTCSMWTSTIPLIVCKQSTQTDSATIRLWLSRDICRYTDIFWLTNWLKHVRTGSFCGVYINSHITLYLEYRPSLFTFGCTWRSGCSSHKDGALRSPRLSCGWTVYTDLLANVTAGPVINTDILLSPTEDLSLQQSIRFISTLVTYFSVRASEQLHRTYIHTYVHTGWHKKVEHTYFT